MKHFKRYGLRSSVWLACVCSAGWVAAQMPDSPERTSPSPTLQAGAVAVPDDKPISLNFQNIDIKALLQVFADFTGLNLVPTDSVSGPVTVRLSEVPWQQALSIVLQSKGLVSRQEGRVVAHTPVARMGRSPPGPTHFEHSHLYMVTWNSRNMRAYYRACQA